MIHNDITSLYYTLFLQHIADSYSSVIKNAPKGHCMKITGLPMARLKNLLPLLRPMNPALDIYILSETEKGADYIHAGKLIELRNDPDKAVLILVPADNSTAAEDSYGDATFQNLAVSELQESFKDALLFKMPQSKRYVYDQVMDLATELKPTLPQIINYILYTELNGYTDEAFGNGIFLFALLPDSKLLEDVNKMRRRFMLNLEKVSLPLADFSATPADRIAALPLKRNTVQRELMRYISESTYAGDAVSLFEDILENHPEFNYASMPWIDKTSGQNVRIDLDIIEGKDPKKELVRNTSGDLVLSIPQSKKGKVSFKITTDPSPKDNPDIFAFEIAVVRVEDFSEAGVLKKAKVNSNKNASRRLSLNIENGMFEDGEYMLRARALDENGIVLDAENEFKSPNVESAYQEAKKTDSALSREHFRMEQHTAFCNESEVFSIDNSGVIDDDETDPGNIDKRTKINSVTQALIHCRCALLSKNENLDETTERFGNNQWEEGGVLSETYTFDYSPSYPYQIVLSHKLALLERTFLDNPFDFGYINALLGGNPTDSKLYDPNDTSYEKPRFVKATALNVPDDLSQLRNELFTQIKESAPDDKGLSFTFDFAKGVGILKEYLSAYDTFLREVPECGQTKEVSVLLQNLDTVTLTVEMPDGAKEVVKLISPLHPLRLAWMLNLYELYQDWEEKTLENPKYRKAWPRKLDKLFLGQLPMDIAQPVLCEDAFALPFQYVGEITFGWGMYAKPSNGSDSNFASPGRQLKAYIASLLNVSHEKRIDSDVSLDLVVRHLRNYCLAHPYTEKLVINLFNAGDADVFARAAIELERLGIGEDLSYEIRLFSGGNLLQSGEAFKKLLDSNTYATDEAEAFSHPAPNKLFPKLRFSLCNTDDFLLSHDKYQSHITFLVNPFAIRTELKRPERLARSFYLNGVICRNVINWQKEQQSYVWYRYISNKTLATPVSETANIEVSLFSKLQNATGTILSPVLDESVPATTLRLNETDMTLLSFIHQSSDWVVTFDKNMGPEFYDLPCTNGGDIHYLLDYIPGEENSGISSYLTVKPSSEIESLMMPMLRKYNIPDDKFMSVLEDVRSVSSSLLMQINSSSSRSFEVIGTMLAKRFLERKGIMHEAFMIPVDLHRSLFEDNDDSTKNRADHLVVKINSRKKEILFTVVEIKCRNSFYVKEELHQHIVSQTSNTVKAIRQHFEFTGENFDRLDKELKILELKSFLEFYIHRSLRYGQLRGDYAQDYLDFLSKIPDGYTVRFKELGIVFDFNADKKQVKDFYGDVVIYTIGKTVIDDIINQTGTLDTYQLEPSDDDRDIITFFEPMELVYKPLEKTLESELLKLELELSNLDETQSNETEEPKSLEVSHPENVPQSEEESHKTDEPQTYEPQAEDVSVDENYVKPQCDVIIGKNEDSPQFGILGKMPSNGRIVGLDLNECNTISLFGVQGAGKSYTIGSVMEMVLKQFSKANLLPAPMAGVIFHYSDSMDYAPEFTSMVFANDDERQLAKLKAEYGIEPNSIKDVVLLAPESQVDTRKAEYPDIDVYPIGFDSGELTVRDWMFLLGATGNDSTYIKELKQIMKQCRNDMSLENIRNGVENDSHFSTSQRSLAMQKLDFAGEYITDGTQLKKHLKPGRLIIVDLRDEFIEKDEALGLFVVMLNIFSAVTSVNGKAFNKFIVFDEAHKYMNNRELVDSITTAIREMRHKGVSVMMASQDPMSLPTEIIELSSIVIMHRFSSPSWVKHVQKAITPLQTLTATEMSALGSGEAYLWANKSTDKTITQRPVKISIRPRITKHGGDTIKAVK